MKRFLPSAARTALGLAALACILAGASGAVAALGDASDNPTRDELAAVLDDLVSTHGAPLVALMLADALEDVRQRPPEGAAVSEPALQRIADRLEALADALEHDPAAG